MLIYNSIRLVLLGFILLGTSSAWCQEDDLGKAESARMVAQAKKAAHYYEVVVKDELTKYYDDRTFLVDARGLLKGAAAEGSEERLDDIRALPGLPVLPDELRTDLPFAGGKEEYTIKYIDMEILMDTSYNDRDIEFVQKLVNMAANMNELRGDRLKIRSGVFPVKKRADGGYVLAEKGGEGEEQEEAEEDEADRQTQGPLHGLGLHRRQHRAPLGAGSGDAR